MLVIMSYLGHVAGRIKPEIIHNVSLEVFFNMLLSFSDVMMGATLNL